MRKLNSQKGITLVALIITIIVLLILAVVAIRSVRGDGIIRHAQDARDKYAQAQTNEQVMLGNYINKVEESIGEKKEINLLEGQKIGEAGMGYDFGYLSVYTIPLDADKLDYGKYYNLSFEIVDEEPESNADQYSKHPVYIGYGLIRSGGGTQWSYTKNFNKFRKYEK